jgi:hypothetical protein
VLEVVATLRRHLPDDTYPSKRRAATGRNSIARPDPDRASARAPTRCARALDDVIPYARRALGWLRAYGLAAENCRLAAEREDPCATKRAGPHR